MGTMGQSKETVNFIIQYLNKVLIDRIAKATVSDPLARSQNTGSTLGLLYSRTGSRLRLSPDIIHSSVDRLSQLGDGNLSFQPMSPHRAPSQPISEPASVFLLKTAGVGVANVLRAGVAQLTQLLFSQKSWMFVMLLVCLLQLYLLHRHGSRSEAISGLGRHYEGWRRDREYWVQRLVVLREELQLLSRRTDAVTREVSDVMHILCHRAEGGAQPSTCPSA